MVFDIMTLFPDLVQTVLGESIIGRAQKNGVIEVATYNIRDYSEDKHRRVDDTPYGGGKGMLMMAPPIYRCYQDICARRADSVETKRVVFMSPSGQLLNQKKVEELAKYDQLLILCGHYEGVDRRIIDEIVDEEISIGDYVLTGGEIPACILVDSIARLVDGVLADAECHEKESISSGYLEYPQYTRPYEYHGVTVPDVLISGHHENIDRWRREKARELTMKNRPDILEKFGGREEIESKQKRSNR